VEFRILGPVELWEAGQRRDLGSAKERCVLAILLWALGSPVSADAIVNRVWGRHPPAKARESLYSYVARLRRRIQRAGADAQARLVSGSGSYTLEADRELVDLHRFRRLRVQARAIGESGDDDQAASLLHEADALWRGEPLAGISGDWAERVRASLVDEHLAATQERIATDLRVGRHADVLGELSDLVSEHPLVETLVEHLMLALYRCGRQADALHAFRQARQRLVDELGTEPSQSLSDLHRRMLQGDPGLAAPRAVSGVVGGAHADNLPRDIPGFIGRQREMRRLLNVATSNPARTAVTVVAIDGMPGVGKSTLAIHAAHRLRDSFPDAQLYLRLYAHDASRGPLDPAAGLEILLRMLGVTAEQMPRGLEERAALWRSHLARRRAVVVLDDAASPNQVDPLLPGAPGCLVLITSRTTLTGLAGIDSISLGVLSGDDASALFTGIVGKGRPADGEAVAGINRLCGHLPLAIHLVASRLSQRSAWSVADLAHRLSRVGDRVGEIYTDNPEIGASFELSYQGLTSEQQRIFRRICLQPGPEFTLPAAAAAAGASFAQTERCLSSLLNNHLLEEPARGRFRFHDLIGAYARDLATRHDSGSDRELTLRRVLDYYLHVADVADRLLYPYRYRIDVDVDHPWGEAQLAGPHDAREWLRAELVNLLAAARYAFDHRLPEHAALLPHVLAQFLQTHGYWEAAITAHTRAARSWRALGDGRGEGRALTDLAFMLTRTGRYDDALQRAQEALDLFRAHADARGEADVLDRIGLAYWQLSRFHEAIAQHEKAAKISRSLGDRREEADALAHGAMSHWHLGSYQEATRRLTQALAIYRDVGDRQGEARALNNIADVELRLGRCDEALHRYEQAQVMARDLGDRQGEAVVLNNMGNAYQHLGRYADALAVYRRALAVYREVGDRRCEADTLNNIGAAFQRTRHYSEAMIHHQKALAVAHDLAEPYQEARALSHIADVHLRGGRHEMALDEYAAVLELSRRIGDPYQEGLALAGMANAQYSLGRHGPARDRWHQALALFERIGVPEADEVRGRLRAANSA
jgi:DNA-binding SARP family transcriptional activator/tetratricopeptide (TPR) repeat protein